MASLPTQLVESHGTDSASVLPLVAVDLLMVLQIVFPLELQWALGTGKGPLRTMRIHVDFQGPLLFEGFGAL